MAVHQGHVEFELKVGKRAQAADDGAGIIRDGEVDQQSGERGHLDVGVFSDVGHDEFNPLIGREHGTFAGIVGYGQGHPIEKFGGSGKHIEMTVGDGIERAGIDTVPHDVTNRREPECGGEFKSSGLRVASAGFAGRESL